MTDKPREVGLSSAGPVLAFTVAELGWCGSMMALSS